MSQEQSGLRLDLGCGSLKKEGTIGVDVQPLPGVDYVVNLDSEPLPFADRSVVYVHSSHFLEHTANPGRIFAEISRVCANNAQIELWTPYAWSNMAFIFEHRNYFTEEIYTHICVKFIDFWEKILGARWILNGFHYVIEPETLEYLKHNRISVDFALKHLHNIAWEFGTYITVSRDEHPAEPPPVRRSFSTGRGGPRYELYPARYALKLRDNYKVRNED